MSNILSKVKKAVFGDYFQKKHFQNGIKEFESTGVTPGTSHLALINLYCNSNGAFSEQYHKKIELQNPAQKQKLPLTGAIGTVDAAEFDAINNELNNDGYVRFKNKVGEDICERIYKYALTAKATIPPKYDSPVSYDPERPLAEIYRFDMVDMMNNPDIQALAMDPVLVNIARNYLKAEPIFDFPAMWWSTTFSKEASSEAAQLYHFDMDRIKWLKIFIYLTDVDMNNGPHGYIKGSHKVGAKPENILQRGYVRIEDKELAGYHKAEDFITLTGGRGEIFAGDTKCWHKGNPLKKGHRLVLEYQYTSSLFGVNYPKLNISNPTAEFKQFCENNPVFASKISFKNAN